MNFDHEAYLALVRPYYQAQDLAHDWAHVQRVVATATALATAEGANLAVVLPAAYLHDVVNVPKNHPDRARASELAAEKALKVLAQVGYPAEFLPAIRTAIVEHSFSRGLVPSTIEAACVQDADRLDALGAIGVLRCAAVNVQLQTKFYDPADPFADRRPLDDTQFMVDHYFVKLLKLADTLQTAEGRAEGARRVTFMRTFLDQLRREL